MEPDERQDSQMGNSRPLAPETDPDQPLFEALRGGDQSVLADLMQRHGRWVRGVVYAVLGQGHELDDVCQQVWLTVWRRADTLEDPNRWKHWLYRTARNAALDVGRRRKRQKTLWQRLVWGAGGAGEEKAEPEAAENLVVQEEYRRALRAIENLPAIYREPFVLRHLEGWTYRQIGETLGLPDDTVETRLVRARRMLREVLTKP